MTSEKEVKEAFLKSIAQTIKVKKIFDSTGPSNAEQGKIVHLEDFTVSFEIPYKGGCHGMVDKLFHAEICLREVQIDNPIEKQTEGNK